MFLLLPTLRAVSTTLISSLQMGNLRYREDMTHPRAHSKVGEELGSCFRVQPESSVQAAEARALRSAIRLSALPALVSPSIKWGRNHLPCPQGQRECGETWGYLTRSESLSSQRNPKTPERPL